MGWALILGGLGGDGPTASHIRAVVVGDFLTVPIDDTSDAITMWRPPGTFRIPGRPSSVRRPSAAWRATRDLGAQH